MLRMGTIATRKSLPVRLTENGRGYVDTLAAEYRVSAAEVVRQALIIAARHEAELTQRLKEVQ